MSHGNSQRESQLPTAAVALDVGGTTTHAALVTERGLVTGTLRGDLSQADGPRDAILDGLRRLVRQVISATSQTYDVQVVGVGFPGPFDYRDGVSLMNHKFASLRGFPLGESLAAGTGVGVYFLNDADAFALGAGRQFPDTDRLLGITLGTGVGSGFVARGDLVVAGDGVPPTGDIWNLPFRDKTVEYFVSAAAIGRAYRHQMRLAKVTVKGIAELARHKDPAAVFAFERFGIDLGEGVAAVTEGFNPHRIVLGGQISKSFDLFGPCAEAVYCEKTGRTVPWNPAGEEHAELIGVGHYALRRMSGRSDGTQFTDVVQG